ncbi:MAG: prepilin-type N-terminal cleavage/methylation domain-containing protein [Planctomycetes bacterium]|nr:prepilin-type N-terminal cleavage/methylation domain-containing protein [Planctomycetota bacterium]
MPDTRSLRPLVNQRGFSLVEMMVVVAVIAILSGILVPNFVQGRVAANESAVIGTLRAISTGQFRFKAMALVDVDGNGGYEYGTIREMTGGTALRGSGGDRLSPNLLPMSLDGVDANGRFLKNGYYFQLYLPDAAGLGVAESAAGIASIAPQQAEGYWTMLAWPVTPQGSGRATFFINQSGEIVKTTEGGYHGTTLVPPAGAGLVGNATAGHIDRNSVAVGVAGADGHVWKPVR